MRHITHKPHWALVKGIRWPREEKNGSLLFGGPQLSRQNQILHSKSKIALILPWVFAFAVKYLVFAVKCLVLPWGLWFCCEVFGFAVRFSVLPWGILFLPWGFWFCREVFCFCHEVFGFAVTVLGHRTFYLLGMWTHGFQIRSTRSVLYRLSWDLTGVSLGELEFSAPSFVLKRCRTQHKTVLRKTTGPVKEAGKDFRSFFSWLWAWWRMCKHILNRTFFFHWFFQQSVSLGICWSAVVCRQIAWSKSPSSQGQWFRANC